MSPRVLITAGIVLIVAGIAWKAAPGLINWFGRLPGDIHFESQRTAIFIPVTSMIIISIVLSALFYLLRR